MGEIVPDPAQRAVACQLDALGADLSQWANSRNSLLSRLGFNGPPPAPRGLYLHGAVGRGKTMLMDLFIENVPFAPKKRCHFHAFMGLVHDDLADARKTMSGDPMPVAARKMASRGQLLCLDELHVTDIADAMILGRLFTALFAEGVVLVATSNAAPRGLYPNGLNRPLFLPFISLIEERLAIVEVAAAKDFRLEKLAGRPLYFAPVDDAARSAIGDHWQRLTGGHPPSPMDLEVKGRLVRIPRTSMGVARLSFAELCETPLGAGDYVALAQSFHTVILEDIPVLAPERRETARRFINLIDALYDNRTGLIASAAAEPQHLHPVGSAAALFERTASRLIEMRSAAYLGTRHRASV